MEEIFTIIDQVAATNTNVLVTGESGTGKELVAKAIHAKSLRRQGPLQVIDCTAYPEALFESILFGHRKGAFTSAVSDQPGLLAQCDGGTAFLDELGGVTATVTSQTVACRARVNVHTGWQSSVSSHRHTFRLRDQSKSPGRSERGVLSPRFVLSLGCDPY